MSWSMFFVRVLVLVGESVEEIVRDTEQALGSSKHITFM